MKLSAELRAFQERLGHVFADPGLLRTALTHSSMDGRDSNERLEFLGDRVLGLSMAEALLAGDRRAEEGKIAPRFNALVRKEVCADVARQIGLGEVLRLGRSEQRTGGRRKEALLGDAMEAVIAAVYRDAGFDAARALVLRLWGERIARVEDDARDPKTILQEWAQARGWPPPAYREVRRTGPDHAPVFTVEAELKDGRTARAEARSKRDAEQEAAAMLLGEVGD
ncbi:MAG: ribonuclease III [Hasllibacter sp.]